MKIVKGLYDSKIEKSRACGYCHFHHCYLTVKQLRAHQCLQKQCNALQKYEEHEWWKQRNLLKQRKKANKQINKLLI